MKQTSTSKKEKVHKILNDYILASKLKGICAETFFSYTEKGERKWVLNLVSIIMQISKKLINK